MNRKLNKFLEITWLTVAVLSLVAGIHKSLTTSLGESWLLFLIALVSMIMYTLKRYLRKKEESDKKE